MNLMIDRQGDSPFTRDLMGFGRDLEKVGAVLANGLRSGKVVIYMDCQEGEPGMTRLICCQLDPQATGSSGRGKMAGYLAPDRAVGVGLNQVTKSGGFWRSQAVGFTRLKKLNGICL